MSKHKYLSDDQKAEAEKKGIQDALKGEYDPTSARKTWHQMRNDEAEEVYKDSFYRTRGANPPKR